MCCACMQAISRPNRLYENQGFIGLSIKQADWNTIKHDITRPFPLKDNTVDFFQAEDVLEHIPYERCPPSLPRYTASSPGARFLRLSVPDYRCDVYASAASGLRRAALPFDPDGAAGTGMESPAAGRTCGFPVFESVKALCDASPFAAAEFYHYYDERGPFRHPPDRLHVRVYRPHAGPRPARAETPTARSRSSSTSSSKENV